MAHTIPYDARIMDGLMTDDPGPLGRWASVATPTLVLDGGASPPWIRHGASALAEVLPNASAGTLDGQGHGAASTSSPRSCFGSLPTRAETRQVGRQVVYICLNRARSTTVEVLSPYMSRK